MSQSKRKSPESAVFEGFSGIDTRHLHSGKPSSADICNFRICDDGSLKKRSGYTYISNLSGDIRAVWTGILNGEEKCFILYGDKIGLYDKYLNSVKNVGTVDSFSGRACFFYYRDRLYLADGSDIYEFSQNSSVFSQTIGYIPLIGKDWQTGKKGEPYEKRNLLCNKARISYKIESYPSVYLHTGWLAQSIDAVYLNGTLVPSSSYIYNTLFKTVDLQGLQEGDEVLIYVTYAAPEDSEMAAGLFTSTAATIFGGLGRDRIFMWGGTKKNVLYSSEFVSRTSMEESLKANSQSSPLYFPTGYEFTAGDGRHDIRAAIRHYDRLLVFTESDAWNTDPTANGSVDVPLVSINQGAGCASMCAVETVNNLPISVGKRTVFSWNSDTDEYNECNATSISAPIDSLLPSGFYESAGVFHAKKHGELWFYSSADTNIWIYNINKKAWYRFSDIIASGFFELGGDIWFYCGSVLYRFDDDLDSDFFENNYALPIYATFSSNILEFSTNEQKRLKSLTMRTDKADGGILLQFSFDKIDDAKYYLEDIGSNHTVFCKRLHSGRFKYASLTLVSYDENMPTIHSIEIGVT